MGEDELETAVDCVGCVGCIYGILVHRNWLFFNIHDILYEVSKYLCSKRLW